MPYSLGKCPWYPIKEGQVNPRVGLDVVEKRTIFPLL
jgi:hypothetical protein